MTTREYERPSNSGTVAPTAPGSVRRPRQKKPKIEKIPVERIRTEDGLSRKRDRGGHRELRNSIEKFGVLTPITVRVAPDGSGDYLLVKGQGRTLACQMLGLTKIPALVLADDFAEDEKVQQFLVENVARLRMRPIDRALLIAKARKQGEETADVARRFGVTPATIRRLEAQLDGATKREVAALKLGTVNLTLHAAIARYVGPEERGDIVAVVSQYSLRTKEIEALFTAFGWKHLIALGSGYRNDRLLLIAWACHELAAMKPGSLEQRFGRLAELLPLAFPDGTVTHLQVAAR